MAWSVQVPWASRMSFVRRVVVEIAAVALSHAAVGVVVHGLGEAGTGAHVVRLPVALVALVVMVACAVRQRTFGARVGGSAVLARRTGGLAFYIVAETVMVDGLGWHVLHDPWLGLAPLGVLLACGGTAVVASIGVAASESVPRVRFSRPRAVLVRRFALARTTWSPRSWAAPLRGRAPPSTA